MKTFQLLLLFELCFTGSMKAGCSDVFEAIVARARDVYFWSCNFRCISVHSDERYLDTFFYTTFRHFYCMLCVGSTLYSDSV